VVNILTVAVLYVEAYNTEAVEQYRAFTERANPIANLTNEYSRPLAICTE
jgi:hypothetical protein